MNSKDESIILIDLPVFPKGVISLSLVTVAGCFTPAFGVKIVDLNISNTDDSLLSDTKNILFGLKVSSQSFRFAVALSEKIKSLNPTAKIVWGGELPTLLPHLCLQHAHSVVSGLFEPIAEKFIADLNTRKLQRQYIGENTGEQKFSVPAFHLLDQSEKYYSFMGYPLETSRGCTEKCIFCMVHVMQKRNYNLKTTVHLRDIISNYSGKFINVVDYNFGVSEAHVVEVARIIKESGATGWMAEMCIELLDNETVLRALSESNCKMIYCGLESIDRFALSSVHKMNTNHIENYERIIRKAQRYGIQIAAGIIIGLEGTHKKTFSELYKFFQSMGIIYAKLTFLTYNPGTKVHEYEKKRGVFINDAIENYDGNRLNFLPAGVDAAYIAEGTEWFIKNYYSLTGIISRSFNTRLSFLQRIEFILFNICYRDVYCQWLKFDVLQQPQNANRLTEKKFSKSFLFSLAEKTLHLVRKTQIKN